MVFAFQLIRLDKIVENHVRLAKKSMVKIYFWKDLSKKPTMFENNFSSNQKNNNGHKH